MSTEFQLTESIEAAAETVGAVWPLHSFVTSNPLAGFEDRPFHEAVDAAARRFGGRGYPSADHFAEAWAAGDIDPDILATELDAHGYPTDPETALELLQRTDADPEPTQKTAATERVDAVLTKWLAAFLDQGQATWAMPNREQGFYAAVRTVAPYDSDIPGADVFATLPDDPLDAIRDSLADYPLGEWRDIFEAQMAALPGWTGYLKQRAADGGDWQSAYPISVEGYLAVRLVLTDQFDAPLVPSNVEAAADETHADDSEIPLPEVWLRAWEATYRSRLLESLTTAEDDGSEDATDDETGERPDAQFVFCIDTRSEIIRRHIEAAGDYETHGYAGFFGIPMRYAGHEDDVAVDACPPIVDAQHRIAERPTDIDSADATAHDRWQSLRTAGATTVKKLRSNAATAFSFVESTGVGYGAALAARTLLPARVYDLLAASDQRTPDTHEFCTPSVDYNPDSVNELREGLTLEEQVEYAATAFELMGWEQFARVVVFAGHASQTTNNPFESSLDCGACAGNPGGPSARVLATICNDEDVRAALRERGHDIPEDTVFVAGEHNTTTDEVDLFTSDVPASHESDVEQLRADLSTAREGVAAERVEALGGDTEEPVRETQRRAADWAETRPEWGLARNAGFVVGPRELTADVDLDGRAFLHSYDWQTDPDGDALEAILTGPMVVTQWINTQYYFSTVDTAVYGSGSKVTQNPVGNVGVYQGNGGDLMTGLPQQSVMRGDDDPYHQPLRLSTVVHAPRERIDAVLAANENLAQLLDNGWLSLTALDPEQDNRAFHYAGDGTWTPATPALEARSPTSPVAADD